MKSHFLNAIKVTKKIAAEIAIPKETETVIAISKGIFPLSVNEINLTKKNATVNDVAKAIANAKAGFIKFMIRIRYA